MNKYQLQEKLVNFFRGRYGLDGLSIFLMILSLVLVNFSYVFILGYIFMIVAIFRTYSKNIYKRKRELDIYNKIIGKKLNKILHMIANFLKKVFMKIRKKYKFYKMKKEQKELYVFFKCKNCKNILKVPKNKGTVTVTCPVCGEKTKKKT